MTGRRSYVLRVSQDHVMLPARIANILEREAGLSSLRVRLRGIDPEASAVLEDIREVALQWRGCDQSTAIDAASQPEQDSRRTMQDMITAPKAAESLRISPQAVHKAIKEQRLPAARVGSQWLIKRTDVEHYRARRTGAA